MKKSLLALAGLALIFIYPNQSFSAESVTVDNYVRAQSDVIFASYVKKGGFGKFSHEREPTPVDKQPVIRMNRDTLYSVGIFDLAQPVTISKPDANGRYQSMTILSQDEYVVAIEYGKGEFTLTKDQVGTRYACVIFRTFMDADDPKDIKAANALQDKISVQQNDVGVFSMPDWDLASLKKVRESVNVLASTRSNTKGMFGKKGEIHTIGHLMGAAYGWGGLPETAAIYKNVVPQKNDGKTPYSLTVKNVPVDGFWSITVYGKDGFMIKNDENAYSYNNKTVQKNSDGSITIHFGSGADTVNNLPITPGWSYIIRMYQPHQNVINGSWQFPEPNLYKITKG